MTLNLKRTRLLSIAVAFVAPLALGSLPAQAQEGDGSRPTSLSDSGPAQGDRPMPGAINFAMALPAGSPMGESPDAGMMDMGARFLKGDVAVTDDQYEKLYQLRGDFMDKFAPKMLEVMTLKRHLKDVLTSADIDTAKANDLKKQMASAVEDLANLKIENEIATMKVYTPEQRKHLRLAVMKCPGLRGWGHHMGGHGGSMGGMRGHGGPMSGHHKPMGEHGEHKHGGWHEKGSDSSH
ncbi:hypothetical protein BH11CYA1_BH11CYA1_47860 [soil metagenome]